MEKDVMERAMDYIAGSCMIDPERALRTILKRDITEDEVDEFRIFLDENECFECEICGWYGHPGEDGIICDDCLADEEEEDED